MSKLMALTAPLLHSKLIQPSPGISGDSPKQFAPGAMDVTDLAERIEEQPAEEKFLRKFGGSDNQL